MKGPINANFSANKEPLHGITDDAIQSPTKRMVFQDYRQSKKPKEDIQKEPAESNSEEYTLNIPQFSDNMLEQIYLLKEKRKQLEEQLRKIDADVKYLNETAFEQGISSAGNYTLHRKEKSIRSLNVDKFRVTYPEIFDKCKKATASSLERAIGKEDFHREMKVNHPDEYSAVARVTISDIKKELPDDLITKVCTIKTSISYDIEKKCD